MSSPVGAGRIESMTPHGLPSTTAQLSSESHLFDFIARGVGFATIQRSLMNFGRDLLKHPS
jgi:hypothetical protein